MQDVTPVSEATQPQSVVPVVWTIDEFVKRSKLPRTLIFEALKCGDLIGHRYGRRRLIFDEDAAAFMNSMSTELCDDFRKKVAA